MVFDRVLVRDRRVREVPLAILELLATERIELGLITDSAGRPGANEALFAASMALVASGTMSTIVTTAGNLQPQGAFGNPNARQILSKFQNQSDRSLRKIVPVCKNFRASELWLELPSSAFKNISVPYARQLLVQ